MAIEKTIEIKTDSKGAEQGFDKLAAAIKELNDTFQKFQSTTEDGLEDVKKGAENTSKGVKKIGGALNNLAKGTGVIFLLSKAFEIFKDIASKNQKVVDIFSTSFEVLSIAFNDFFNFIFDNAGGIVDFFKAIFEDPKQSLIDFADAFKRNIQERFESYLDTLGFLASAVKKVFSGDFKGALEDVKNAGKESIDVFTGVNNTFEKATEFVGEATDAVKNYATETFKAASENVKLAKAAELAAVKNQGLIEKYDRQAEQLRQIRDDESKNIKERIKANEDLAKVLDEQEKAMQENAAIAVAAAGAELSKNKQNIELQKAYAEALNEQAAIEAQITGFRSEQQTNTNSLLREQKEIQNELALIGKSERDVQREELQQQYLEQKELIDRQVTDEIQKNELLLEAKRVYDEQIKVLNDEFDAEDSDRKTKQADDEIALGNAVLGAKLDQAKRGLQLIGEIAGKGSKIGKAVAIGQATISGVEGTINAFTTASGSPITKVFPAYPFIQAGLAAGFAATNIAKIKSTDPSGGGGGASGSTPSGGGGSQPANFNIVGASDTNQLADAIGGQTQQPVQAYVVANDVTTAQSLQNNIVEGATIG